MIVGGRVIIKCFFSFRGQSCNQMLLLGIKFGVQVFGWGLLQRQCVGWFISLSVLLDQIARGVGLAESASYDPLWNVWELEVQCTYVLDWELVWLIHPEKGWASRKSSEYLKFLISDSGRAGYPARAVAATLFAPPWASGVVSIHSIVDTHSLMATKRGDFQLIWNILVLDVARLQYQQGHVEMVLIASHQR